MVAIILLRKRRTHQRGHRKTVHPNPKGTGLIRTAIPPRPQEAGNPRLRILNRYKDSFAKKHVVVIKSQTGMPIEAFNGDSIKWDIDDNLPKTTRLMVDGKTMYIHRANFQIMDKDSLQ